MPVPPFDECRHAARRHLSEAADWIRAGDWEPPPSPSQRAGVRLALHHIGEAKAALDQAADPEGTA